MFQFERLQLDPLNIATLLRLCANETQPESDSCEPGASSRNSSSKGGDGRQNPPPTPEILATACSSVQVSSMSATGELNTNCRRDPDLTLVGIAARRITVQRRRKSTGILSRGTPTREIVPFRQTCCRNTTRLTVPAHLDRLCCVRKIGRCCPTPLQFRSTATVVCRIIAPTI